MRSHKKPVLVLSPIVAILLTSCCLKTFNTISSKKSLPSSFVIEKPVEEKQQAIELARNFMIIAYGRSRAVDLIGDYPPRATYYPETKRWNVYFTNGVSTCNIELDRELLKGTVSRIDGKVIKRSIDDDATIYKMPLFTLDEFEEIMKLPHNKNRNE